MWGDEWDKGTAPAGITTVRRRKRAMRKISIKTRMRGSEKKGGSRGRKNDQRPSIVGKWSLWKEKETREGIAYVTPGCKSEPFRWLLILRSTGRKEIQNKIEKGKNFNLPGVRMARRKRVKEAQNLG